MLEALRNLTAKQPFVPFAIHTAGGAVLHVPMADHIAINPKGSGMVVFDDDGAANLVSVRLIDRIVTDFEAAESVVA